MYLKYISCLIIGIFIEKFNNKIKKNNKIPDTDSEINYNSQDDNYIDQVSLIFNFF